MTCKLNDEPEDVDFDDSDDSPKVVKPLKASQLKMQATVELIC